MGDNQRKLLFVLEAKNKVIAGRDLTEPEESMSEMNTVEQSYIREA